MNTDPAGRARALVLRIDATDLPGRDCAPAPGFPGYRDIRVAVQRRNRPGELLDPQPGDAPSASWTLPCTATPAPAEPNTTGTGTTGTGTTGTGTTGTDITGPYVQGRPGARFVYLNWLAPDDSGAPALFRRAKLMLDAVDPATAAAAVESGLLVARLGLTDAKGNPLCAAVRPPLVAWSAA